MKTTYKILIACAITFVLTAIATAYVTSLYYTADVSEMVCKDGASPDINGCCPGEEYKDLGDEGFACCPMDGGDCFPPIVH